MVVGFWKVFNCDSSLWFSLETALFQKLFLLSGHLGPKGSCNARASARKRARMVAHIYSRCIMLQAWLVYQNEVPMGATNWHRNQGSEAFSFLTGGFWYGCNARAQARMDARISSTDVRFTQKIIVHLKATMSCIIYNHNVTNLTILCGFCGPKTTKNSPKSKI